MSLYKVILILVIFAVAVASETNADRFRRGLPPLKPRKVQTTRTRPEDGARRVPRQATPSCVPLPTLHGVIQIVNQQTGAIGYLGNERYAFGTTTLASAFAVDLEPSLPSPFWIQLSSPVRAAYPYLGGAGPATNLEFSAGSSNAAYLTGTQLSAAGSPPTGASEEGTSEPGESTIWTMDCVTWELTATWINPSGTSYPATLASLTGSFNYIDLVGDIAAFSSQKTVSDQVLFYFVPVPQV